MLLATWCSLRYRNSSGLQIHIENNRFEQAILCMTDGVEYLGKCLIKCLAHASLRFTEKEFYF